MGETAIEAGGTVVHLEGYGLIRVFRIVSRDGDTEHWATDDLAMDELTRLGLAQQTWAIENDHRGLKPVLRSGAMPGAGWASRKRNHIGMADPGVPAAGASFLHNRGELVPGQGANRPRGDQQPISPSHCTAFHDRVTPKHIAPTPGRHLGGQVRRWDRGQGRPPESDPGGLGREPLRVDAGVGRDVAERADLVGIAEPLPPTPIQANRRRSLGEVSCPRARPRRSQMPNPAKHQKRGEEGPGRPGSDSARARAPKSPMIVIMDRPMNQRWFP